MVFVCSYTDVSENGDNDVGLTSFTESLYLWADSKRRPTLKKQRLRMHQHAISRFKEEARLSQRDRATLR